MYILLLSFDISILRRKKLIIQELVNPIYKVVTDLEVITQAFVDNQAYPLHLHREDL